MVRNKLVLLSLHSLAFGVIFAFGANDQEKTGKVVKITAQELKQMILHKDFLLLNVHIPYDGEIPQTDLFLPYDKIENFKTQLPEDKGKKIVLYCRSGHMSAIAAQKLAELGYQNVYDLPGGMIAWKEAGFELTRKNRESPKKSGCCGMN